MTTSTQTDSTKHLTLVYRITSPAQQTRLLAEGQWIASCHTDAMAERDALRNEVAQLEPLLQEAAAIARENRSRAVELEVENARLQQMLDAVGAGGVEPLRKRVVEFGSAEEFSSSDDPHCKDGGKACIDCLMRGECLHQTVQSVPAVIWQEPTGDMIRAIARNVRTSASDDAGPHEYVIAGWKAAVCHAVFQPQPAPPPPAVAHPDDAAVDALAVLMKAKLAKQRKKGYGDWETPECTQHRLSALLRDHVDKGDPVDVANFCAFLSARGEGVAPQPPVAEQKPVAWRTRDFKKKFLRAYHYTDIGLQAEAWEKQGLQVDPLYAVPQPSTKS